MKRKIIKKVLKVILGLVVFVLGLAAFYGYHIYKAISLDNHEIGNGYYDNDAEMALDHFLYSLEKINGERDDSVQVDAGDYFHEEDFLVNNSYVDGYSFFSGNEQNWRYERFVENIVFHGKEYNASVIAMYRKVNGGWFNEENTVKFEDGDTSFVMYTGINFENASRVDMKYRKNGRIITLADYSIREPNSLSQKPYNADSSRTEFTYDELNRLVELKMNGKTVHFVYGTNDTTNLDVKMVGDGNVELGYYKRSCKKNKEIARYGTRKFDVRETKYFEKDRLVKIEYEKEKHYDNFFYRELQYDSAGNEVKDSSYREFNLLPGFCFDVNAQSTARRYNEKKKIVSKKTTYYIYERYLNYFIFPLRQVEKPKFSTYEYSYDANDRIFSVDHQGPDSEIREQFIFGYDFTNKFLSKSDKYSTCLISPTEISKLEWNSASDLLSVSTDGMYKKEYECFVADGRLTCENKIYKKEHAFDAYGLFCWSRCLYKMDENGKVGKNGLIADTTNQVFSVPLTKDSLIYLNETMLESDIDLDSILCDQCEIQDAQDTVIDSGKTFAEEHFSKKFTCKVGDELYEFQAWDRNLWAVRASYGRTKDVPKCLVGFKPTNGIRLGLTKSEVDSLHISFEKKKSEWSDSRKYPVDEQFTEYRDINLKFCGDKLCQYEFYRGLWN